MKLSVELKQQRAAKLQEIEALNKKAESRSFTDEEQKQFDTLFTEIENLAAQIDSAEKREKMAAQFGDNGTQPGAGANNGGTTTHFRADMGDQDGETKELVKIAQQYRLLRGIKSFVEKGKIDGVEGEMMQEAQTELTRSGIAATGNLQIPYKLTSRGLFGNNTQKRDLTATGPGGAATTEGGYTIQTDVEELIPILRPDLTMINAGARLITGLVGNVAFPRHGTKSSATWEGENDDNAETSPAFEQITASPKRLGAYLQVSKQLLAQSTIDAENFAREDLNLAVNEALDYALINGDGSTQKITGILNTANVNSVALGTDGAVPDWTDIVQMETEVATDNALRGRLAYVTTNGIRGLLKTTEKASSTGQFIWQDVPAMDVTQPIIGMLNGYRAFTSSQIPSNLAKGGSGNVCHAILFGNFNELVVLQWAGIDLVIDPYTDSKKALVNLVINSWWDAFLRHPVSFCHIKDAKLS